MVARIISRFWRRLVGWDGWYMFPFTVMRPQPELFTTHCTICVRPESVVNMVL